MRSSNESKSGRRRKRKQPKWVRCITALLTIIIVALTWFYEAGDDSRQQALPVSGDGLFVHFIDVGQGDAALITCGDAAMMIDFGNNDKGTLVQKYLQDQNIDHLDYAVGTHPDADHIGGMDVVLYKFDTKNVWMPDITADTKTYRDVIDTCKNRGYTPVCPQAGETYPLGEASVKVLAPFQAYDDTNSSSICLMITYGETKFLFCGDATAETERDMLARWKNLSADVFKLSHHGSSSSNTEEFLYAVDPDAVVISCAAGNDYGHPHREVVDSLKDMDVDVYRTDLQGTLIACSDGKTITWNVAPTDDLRNGEAIGQ